MQHWFLGLGLGPDSRRTWQAVVQQHLQNALRFFSGRDAFRTPPSVGMDGAVDMSGLMGDHLTSRSTESFRHDAITFVFFPVFCFALILKHFIFCV